ncbi:Microtubule-associated protein 1A [Bienertia sinuspersici]
MEASQGKGEASNRGRGKNKRYWNYEEDAALIRYLHELSCNPKWKSENVQWRRCYPSHDLDGMLRRRCYKSRRRCSMNRLIKRKKGNLEFLLLTLIRWLRFTRKTRRPETQVSLSWVQ